MYGRTNRAVGSLTILLLSAAVGCDDRTTVPSPESSVPSTEGQLFDADSAGTITGRVVWKGTLPSVPPLLERPAMGGERHLWPNPNAPIIDPTSHAVQGAVVFLRGVDARRARPWDHSPVRIVQQGKQFHILQDDSDSTIGLVRRGDAVEMVSADAVFHSLHSSGAAYFNLAFPDRDQPRTRRLTNTGVVELTSAAGYFWMRGYLFVDDHPYYTRSGVDGRFRLTDVPQGRYELVRWLPDWREQRHERDPETSLVTRLYFREPLEVVRPVEVKRKENALAEFEMPGP